MAGTLNGWAEPDEADQPRGEVEVAVTIPEVFAGVSLQELTTRGGRITTIEAHEESVTINATLPAFHYNALVEALILETDGRGHVRLAES